MDNKKFIVDKYPVDIATRIYELSKDMDFMDYTENKKEELEQLTNAIEFLKACAQNEYNNDYFRTLYRALENI